MKRNNHHPDYDATKELLCLLPIEPCGVHYQLFADDLGCNGMNIMCALGTIRDHGIGIKFYGPRICVKREDRMSAWEMGERYWDQVYAA